MKTFIPILLMAGLLSAPPFVRADAYRDHAQLSRQLSLWADQYRQLLKVHELGRSQQGREIWGVTLSKAARPEEQPALLIVAGVDGPDLASSEVALGFIKEVLDHGQAADSVTSLLQQTTFYIIPRLHPDAGQHFFVEPAQEQFANFRPRDNDRDGRVDEDGCEDLNQDGLITQMRVRDPEGEFIIDDQDPQLLRRADRSKGEIGCYRLFQEGFDNDHDGLWNEDGPGGVAPDQNFSFAWQESVVSSGDYPFSEPETRSLADFCFSHANIAAVLTLTNHDNLLNAWPASPAAWQWPQEGEVKPMQEMPPQDAAVLRYVSDQYKKISGRDQAPENGPAAGDLAQWAYYHFGRWSLATRAWWPALVKVPQDSSKKQDSGNRKESGKDSLAMQRRVLHWLQKHQPDGWAPWQLYQHPDFPNQQVEIGGFKPFMIENPPADSLGVIIKKMNPFILRLASWLPRTVLQQSTATCLHKGVYRLETVLVNQGYFPTTTTVGSRMNVCRKLKVELSSESELIIASGNKIQLLETLPGSGGAKRISWIISGKPDQRMTIKAGSPMSGFSEQVVRLP
jgi:hypothetical protein